MGAVLFCNLIQHTGPCVSVGERVWGFGRVMWSGEGDQEERESRGRWSGGWCGRIGKLVGGGVGVWGMWAREKEREREKERNRGVGVIGKRRGHREMEGGVWVLSRVLRSVRRVHRGGGQGTDQPHGACKWMGRQGVLVCRRAEKN